MFRPCKRRWINPSFCTLAASAVLAAGWLATETSGQDKPSPGSQISGPPKYEHFAFCCMDGYLDGPRKEAMAPVTKAVSVDDEGNLYFIPAHGDSGLRVARMDGMVETIAGADYWHGRLNVDEGPASFIPHLQRVGGIGNPISTVVAVGNPLRDGPDGQPAGYLLTRAGLGTGLEYSIYKVWRNKEKGGRWWFKRIIGLGKSAPPTEVGKSIAAKDVFFDKLPFITTGRVGGKLNVYFHSEGNLWQYDDAQGTLTCVLSTADYLGKPEIGTRHDGKPLPPAEKIVVTPDGSFYLGWYQGNYPKGTVVKVTADRKKAWRVAQDAGDVNKRWDGDALTQAAFFGGPLLAGGTWAPDIVFFGAVDDAPLRRFKDGRVSTLCKDGEWREFPTKQASGGGELTWQACPPDKAPAWGRGWVMADPGYFYQLYSMGGGDAWVWRVGPIDFGKESIQKLP
ncbi:MAG: hypothetical protein N3E46_00235 [Gemmataceae bacterium]|nr:hypothetical protein [Gemmataceae bacterium]GIW84110.1 MAG: hypothetical protein KatS3mg106_623 [Gemmataceae bacterium]